MTPDVSTEVIPAAQWQQERRVYLEQVTPFVERRRYRRSRGLKHPIEDFIWEYYSLRGSRLLKWQPGAGRILEAASAEEFPESDGYRESRDGRSVDAEVLLARRASGIRWIRNLLESIDSRPPVFSCLGLHEWAMVYEEKDIRHDQLPLRLSHRETRELVERFPLQCTHYDAFRFFSRSARPLNAQPLSSDARTQHEQPGCLHVQMDLFKWCMKLQPLVPSSLTLDCFDLACRAREVDMRASPYDVRSFGREPIPIETPAGRAQYVKAQQQIAAEGAPLRARLRTHLMELEPVAL
jgi:hypothetical protein